jgi:diguanylate cyclase (GGDEF)-like protein
VRGVVLAQLRHAVGAQVAAVAAVVIILLAGPLNGLSAARVSWLASAGFAAATLVAAGRIAGRLPAGAPARRFWWAIGAMAVATGGGYLLQAVTANHPDDLALNPVSEALLGLGAVAVVIIMCTYPLGASTAGQRLRVGLDMTTVMVCAAVFGWYVPAPAGGHTPLAILAGPVVMLVAVFAVTKLLLAGRPPFSFQTGLLGAAAAAIGGVLGSAAPSLLAHGHADWLFAFSALGDGCMMVAVWLQLRQVQVDPQALQRPRRRSFSVLPYVAVAAVYGLLFVVAAHAEQLGSRTWPVLIGAAVSTALVVIRQLTAFADNDRLLGQLRHTLRERDELTTRLRDMAFRDSLTGLANRALFHDRLDSALARAHRSGATVAVMLIDLDDFKPVNDRHGHAAGDAVLRAVADRVRTCLRDTDTVARLGGDEFAVVLDNPLPESLTALARRIVAATADPYWHGGERLTVGASIGLAVNIGGQCDGDRLLRDADAAMYAAKRSGKNSFATYPVMAD